MRFFYGFFAGLVLAGILAIAPTAAFADDGWHEGHYGYGRYYGYEHRHEYRGRDWYGGGHRGWYGHPYWNRYSYYGYQDYGDQPVFQGEYPGWSYEPGFLPGSF